MFVRGRHRDNSNNIGCVLAAGTTNACVWWFTGKQRRVVSLETLRERYMPVDLAGAESVLGEGKAVVPFGTEPLSLDDPPEQPPARVTLSIELDGDNARRWLELKAHRAGGCSGGSSSESGSVPNGTTALPSPSTDSAPARSTGMYRSRSVSSETTRRCLPVNHHTQAFVVPAASTQPMLFELSR
jgi:hypothetical protein